jgi:hypothetical protein
VSHLAPAGKKKVNSSEFRVRVSRVRVTKKG